MVLDTSFQSIVIKYNNTSRLTTSLNQNKHNTSVLCDVSTWGAEAGLSPERGRRGWCLSRGWRRGQSTWGWRRGRSPTSQRSVAHGQWGRAVPVVRLRVVVVPAFLMTRLHLKELNQNSWIWAVCIELLIPRIITLLDKPNQQRVSKLQLFHRWDI